MMGFDTSDFVIVVVFVLLVIWLCYRNKEDMTGAPSVRQQLLNTSRSKIQDKRGMSVNDHLLERSLNTGRGLPGRFQIR